MNFLDKMKDLVLGSDDGFEDLPEEGYEEPAAPQKPKFDPIEKYDNFESYEPKKTERKVVDFGSASSYSRPAASRRSTTLASTGW